MLVSIIAVALAAVAFALVGYPLLRERREEAPEATMPDEVKHALEDLAAQRDATYSAIKELDFDQEMGNLPEADYQELRARYRKKAALILRDLDELQDVPAPRQHALANDVARREARAEDDIEREVMRRRHRRSPAGVDGRDWQKSDRVCGNCGASVESRDKFCRGCGTPYCSACPACGTSHQTGDRFCSRCGRSLAGVAAL